MANNRIESINNLPGASHFVQMYDPSAVNALLIPFLKGA